MLLIPCMALTRSQLRFWRNTETLFTHAIAVTKNNWVAHYNLAFLALHRYQDIQRGSVEEQVVHLDSELLDPSETGTPPRDYLEEVIHHCQQTLQSKPGFPDAHVTLARALTEKGRLDEARAHLELAVRLDPKNADARQNFAEVLHRQGRVADAVEGYQAALKLKPDWQEVLNNLAWLLATHPSPGVRNGPEAVRLVERACTLTARTNLWFLQTLAAAYAESGDFERAVNAAEQARRLAVASGRTNLVNLAETRLELYNAHQPLRAP